MVLSPPDLRPVKIHAEATEIADQGVVEIEEKPLTEDSVTSEGPPAWQCYCVTGLRRLGYELPPPPFNADQFSANATPHIGGVALFNYNGIDHVAGITGVGDTLEIEQYNKEECTYTVESMSWNDPNLVGFWSAERYVFSGAQKAP